LAQELLPETGKANLGNRAMSNRQVLETPHGDPSGLRSPLAQRHADEDKPLPPALSLTVIKSLGALVWCILGAFAWTIILMF